MPRPTGQLDRTLDAMTIDLLGGQAERHRQVRFSEGHESEQQIKLSVSGEAANGASFTDEKVHFVYALMWAPAQRECPFALPHFSYGIELTVVSEEPILIHAQVKEWIKDDSSRVTGAVVRFLAQAPNTETPVPFSAIAHLTFQGWTAETEQGEAQ